MVDNALRDFSKFSVYNSLKLTSTVNPKTFPVSYALVAPRLLGFDYADFLKFCQKEFNAEIVGKNTTFPDLQFSSKQEAQKLADFLHERAAAVLG